MLPSGATLLSAISLSATTHFGAITHKEKKAAIDRLGTIDIP